LKSAAAALVSLLVDHSDNNVRLVTLDRLIHLKQKHPLVLQGMVLDLCRVLQAPSPDIRSRCLALITDLVTTSNVDNVLASLKKELLSRGSDTLPADADFKASIVTSLVALTSNFPDTASTICNALLDLITDGAAVAVEAMNGVREIIAVFPDVRPAATQRLRDVIGSVRLGKVLRIVVACLSEFSSDSSSLKASLDATFAMIGPLPLQVAESTDSKPGVSNDRPKVLADGSYASQSSIGGVEVTSSAANRHPLVVCLLQGDYSIGVSIASSLSKLLVSYKGSGCDQAEVSRLCVNLILLCSSVMRLTNVDGSKGMDSDSLEKLCSIMSVARCHVTQVSHRFCFQGPRRRQQQRRLPAAVDCHECEAVQRCRAGGFMRLLRLFQALRTDCDLQVKAGKNRKAVVQDNSVLARVDDAITFRLLHRWALLHCLHVARCFCDLLQPLQHQRLGGRR
jgi:coatomer subunit beta